MLRRWWAHALIVLMLIVLTSTALRKGGAWDPQRFNDFRAYHTAAKAALDRNLESAYHDPDRPYQYPPTLATLVAPLGWLPYRVGLWIWVLAKVALLLWILRALGKLASPRVVLGDLALGMMFCYRFLDSDFANGNANLLCLGAVVGGIYLLRRNCPRWGGFVLALAACVKATPLLFLPWFIVQRRWQQVAGFTVGLLLWGLLVPVLVLGRADYTNSCSVWYHQLLGPINPLAQEEYAEARDGYVPGQSLRSFLQRFLRPIDASAHDDASIRINVADVPERSVDITYAALSVAFLGGVFLVYRRRRVRRSAAAGDTDVDAAAERDATAGSPAELSAVLALSVLIAPLARKASFVALLPAAIQSRALIREKAAAGHGSARWLRVAWWLGFAMVSLTAPAVVGREIATYIVCYCPASGAAVVLLAVLGLAEPRHGPRTG